MTASEVAMMLGARKVKAGVWMAKCPSHPDSHPSLQIKEGKRAVLLCCQSNHCTVEEIAYAMGIRMRDLWYDTEVSREAQDRIDAEHRIEALKRKQGLMMWILALEPEKRGEEILSSVTGEIERLRTWLYPKETKAEYRQRVTQERIRRHGCDWMWDKFLSTDYGKAAAEKYGRK
jgi:hypothetical protein